MQLDHYICQSNQFCALEYTELDSFGQSSPDSILVFFLRLKSGSTKLLVRSNWQDIVLPSHHRYFSDLLSDLSERGRVDPDALFAQISSLSVGPLLTHSAGDLNDYPQLQEICNRFVEV